MYMIRVYENERQSLKHNFGDEISALLIEKILGTPAIGVSQVKDANLVAIGSVLEHFASKKYRHKIPVWGTGFIAEPDVDEMNFDNLCVKAVRGRKTAEKLGFSGPLGDPALLMARYYPAVPNDTRGKIGVIPHYVDKNHPILTKINPDKFFLIDVEQDPLTVIQEITSADAIISSSLHGLILADAYGIPNTWVKFSNKVGGDGFKFFDYFSGVNREIDKPLDLSSEWSEKCILNEISKWTELDLSDLQDNLVVALVDAVALIDDSGDYNIKDVDHQTGLLSIPDSNQCLMYTGKFNFNRKQKLNPKRYEKVADLLSENNMAYSGMDKFGFSVFKKKHFFPLRYMRRRYWRGTWDFIGYLHHISLAVKRKIGLID